MIKTQTRTGQRTKALRKSRNEQQLHRTNTMNTEKPTVTCYKLFPVQTVRCFSSTCLASTILQHKQFHLAISKQLLKSPVKQQITNEIQLNVQEDLQTAGNRKLT